MKNFFISKAMAFPLSYFVKPQVTQVTMTPYGPVPIGVVPSGIFPAGVLIPNGMVVQHSYSPVFQVQKEYDFAIFLILTKNHLGQFQLLMPSDRCGNISLYEQKIYNSDNPDVVMEKMMNNYGINSHNVHHLGKFTQMKHHEKTSGLTYKIGVLYIPSCSPYAFNSVFQSINGNFQFIDSIDLDVSYRKTTLLVANVVYAIKNMIGQFC